MRVACRIGVFGFVWLIAGAAAAWESPEIVPADRVLPPEAREGPGWVIDPEVEADGVDYRFVVRSPHFGDIPAIGTHDLSIRTNEARALEALHAIQSTGAYAKALLKAGVAPLLLLENLALHPVESVVAIPVGLGRAATKAGKWIAGDRRERSDTENSALLEAIGWSRRKRELAARLDVDPYSSNEILQDQLDRVSWSSFAGGLTLQAAFIAAGIPPLMGIIYRVTNVQKTTAELATSVSGGDLYRAARASLVAHGLPAERVVLFLNNPAISPTQKAAIAIAIEPMADVPGVSEFVEAGIEVESPEQADWLVQSMDLARAYHENVAPLAAISRANDDLLLHARSGALVTIAPADWLMWTPRSAALANALAAFQPTDGEVSSREVWVTGGFSPAAIAALTERGIATREQVREVLAD